MSHENWNNFEIWLNQFGIDYNEHINIEEFKESGRGMKALRDIPTNNSVVEIPTSLLITKHNLIKESQILECEIKVLNEIECLVLWVLMEANKPDSFWQPYIKILPENFDTVLMTLEDELVDSLPFYLKDKLKIQKSKAKISYQKINNFVNGLIWDRFIWAWLAVNTRCITLNTKDLDANIALAPFLDCLNHSLQANVTTFYDHKAQKFKIVTHVPYKKGDQVFISYGPHDNHFLLTEYGFILPDNPYDYIPCDNMFCEVVESFDGLVKNNMESIKTALLELGLSTDFVLEKGCAGFPLLSALKLCFLDFSKPLSDEFITMIYNDEFLDDSHEEESLTLLNALCQKMTDANQKSMNFFSSKLFDRELYHLIVKALRMDIELIKGIESSYFNK